MKDGIKKVLYVLALVYMLIALASYVSVYAHFLTTNTGYRLLGNTVRFVLDAGLLIGVPAYAMVQALKK